MAKVRRLQTRHLRLLLLASLLVVACGAPLTPTPTAIRPLSATATARAAVATGEANATATAAAVATNVRGSAPSTEAAMVTLTVAAARTATAVVPTVVTTMPPNAPVTFAWEWRPAPGGVERIARAAADGQGFVYLLDSLTSQVVKLDRDGQIVLSFGTAGTGPGQFTFRPTGATTTQAFSGALAADRQGFVYVADLTNRIQKFDSQGQFVLAWGSEGSARGQLSRPTSLAIDAQGNILVADGDNNRVQKFDPSGTYLHSWGTEGIGDGQFIFRPSSSTSTIGTPGGSLTIDGQGNVYVADLMNRIQKFDANGVYQTQWGVRGGQPSEFGGRGPQITADGRGIVYATDGGNYRLQVFNAEGNFLAMWGVQGSGVGQFSAFISAVAVDSQGAIYVFEGFTPRIQKFVPKAPWPNAARGTPTPRPPTPTITPSPIPTATSPSPLTPPRVPSQTPVDR